MPMLKQRDKHYAFSRPEAAGLGRGPAGEPAWARHSGHGPGPDLPIGRQASLQWRARPTTTRSVPYDMLAMVHKGEFAHMEIPLAVVTRTAMGYCRSVG
jgi:hypothetical protein